MCSKSDDRRSWTEMRLASNRFPETTYNCCNHSRENRTSDRNQAVGKESCVNLLMISRKIENKLVFCQLCVYLLVKKQ